jgi:hypothetical protein
MTDKFDLMLKIIERAEPMAQRNVIRIDRLTSLMDLDNADKQYPLDLDAMLAADDGNFAHDFFGIRSHMNRENGKLEHCFVPRFAKQEKAA